MARIGENERYCAAAEGGWQAPKQRYRGRDRQGAGEVPGPHPAPSRSRPRLIECYSPLRLPGRKRGLIMPFAVHTRTQPGVTGRDATIFILDDGAGGRAEVWPALGFNCFHWEAVRDGRTLDLLYADPALFGDGRPTRSGIPILFPFPNRIRDGRFTWDGKEYQLPLNDPSAQERHPRLRLPSAVARRRPRGGRLLRLGDGRVPDAAATPRTACRSGRPTTSSASPTAWERPAARRGRSGQSGSAVPCPLAWAITPISGCRSRPEPTAADCLVRAPARRSGRWSNRCRPANAGRSTRPAISMRRAASATCSSTTC